MSTRTLARARSGSDGGGAGACTTGRARCGLAGAAVTWCFGARCTAPIPISAASSTVAIAPPTSVAARHGKLVGICSACCTARTDSICGALLLQDPGPGSREPVVERVSRMPPELARGERGVEDASLQLAEPRSRERRFARDATGALDRFVQLDHRRLDARADVEDAAFVVERGEHR